MIRPGDPLPEGLGDLRDVPPPTDVPEARDDELDNERAPERLADPDPEEEP